MKSRKCYPYSGFTLTQQRNFICGDKIATKLVLRMLKKLNNINAKNIRKRCTCGKYNCYYKVISLLGARFLLVTPQYIELILGHVLI